MGHLVWHDHELMKTCIMDGMAPITCSIHKPETCTSWCTWMACVLLGLSPIAQTSKVTTVNRLIINHVPMTEHLFISYHMCFILSDLKCYVSVTSSSRNHIWSAKEKEQWKNNKKNKLFQLTKCVILILFSLWTTPTFKPHNSFISYSF